MSGEVSYSLGGVKLPYLYVEWPKYRGVFARVVTMECPGEHWKTWEESRLKDKYLYWAALALKAMGAVRNG